MCHWVERAAPRISIPKGDGGEVSGSQCIGGRGRDRERTAMEVEEREERWLSSGRDRGLIVDSGFGSGRDLKGY